MSKEFEKLTIKDNFMFGAVMKNPNKCKAVLECILGITIRKIEYPELEKTIDNTYESRGVRLDVYVEDDANTIYNIEMQATNKKNLPKRTRYYQGMIDLNIINKGDDTVVIILNTKGTANDVDDEIKDLLSYIGGNEPHSILAKSLDEEVQIVKSNEDWKRDYMTLLMRAREQKNIGHYEMLVSQIRDINISDIDTASKYLKVSADYIKKVLSLINDNPDMEDEEIAEILVDDFE